MKFKYVILFAFIACCSVCFFSQGTAAKATNAIANTELDTSEDVISALTTTFEPISIHFYGGATQQNVVPENSKLSDKFGKYKLLEGENFRIQQSVTDYLFYISSVTSQKQVYIKFQRLNI